MLWAAGEEAPKKVFAHGFVYIKNEESGTVEKISKSLGNVVEPMEVDHEVQRRGVPLLLPARVPVPVDGEFGWGRFAEVYNTRAGEQPRQPVLSREMTLTCEELSTACFDGTAGQGARDRSCRDCDLALFVARRSAGTSRRAGTTWRSRRSCRTS